MNNNGNKPVEEEFRSSQIYKTLTGSGIPVADKIAQGLGKAAQGLDTALGGIAPGAKQNANRTGAYYQRYTQGPGQAAPPGAQTAGRQTAGRQAAAPQAARPQPTAQTAGAQTAGRQAVPQGNGYSYQYVYPNGVRQPTAQTYPGRKPAGVNPVPAPQMPQMKVVRKGSPAKFYITGIAALLYALSFSLYEPAHYIVFALVLVGVFLLSGKLFRGKKEFVPIEPVKPKEEPKKQEEEKPSKTGNPEVDKIIDGGNGYLKKLRAANDAIPDESMSEDIERMERASADIFRYIADHPEKAPQIRKFMNYYLPTTLKLLNSYQRLSAQSVKGENITSTMFNIAGMMHTVADAFEKQLDSLFTDEAMDISADISVFETLLKQEGFVEEKKEKK